MPWFVQCKLVVEGLIALPIVPSVKMAASTEAIVAEPSASEKKLRALGVAFHRYFDKFHRSPSAIKKNDGTPSELSWRVHLLPYIDQATLYSAFALEEAWDSDTNIKLVDRIPHIYQGKRPGPRSPFCIFTGPQALLGSNGRNWTNARDGVSNCILFVAVNAEHAVPWTKPSDIELTDSIKIADLADGNEPLTVVTADGSSLLLPAAMPDEVLRAMATREGNELLDSATVRRLGSHMLGKPIVDPLAQHRWEKQQLKSIVLAMHYYEDLYRQLPPGRPLAGNQLIPESYQLSWRVHILPMLGHQNLYNQFRLREPWDSPHNIQLLPLMPDVFRDADDAANSTNTRCMVFSGPRTPFAELGQSLKRSQVTDGASNTILVFQAPEPHEVPWTKPEDYAIDLDDSEKLSGLRSSTGLLVALFDGSVRALAPDIQGRSLRALITPAGGEIVTTEQLGEP